MGKSYSTTKSTVRPFTGAMEGKYNSFLDTSFSRFNNNANTAGLGQFNGQTGDMSGTQYAQQYGQNMIDNPALTAMAKGENLDPTKDANFMKSLGYAQDAIQKSGGKSFDNINALMGTRGLGKNSSMWQNMQRQNAESTMDKVGETTSSMLSNQYNQNVNNMFQANNQMQGFANYLRQTGLDTYNMSSQELDRALNLYKTKVGMDDQAYQELAKAIQMGANPETTQKQTSSSNDWIGSLAGAGLSLWGGSKGWI